MRRLTFVVSCLAFLLVPAGAAAHPLGNFTVNHFTRIEVSGDRLYLRHVLDLAEIPTFQDRDEVAAKGEEAYGRDLAAALRSGLSVTVDGSPAELRVLGHELTFGVGAGGLATTRLEVVLDAGPLPESETPVDVGFADAYDPDRIGWREVVLTASNGAMLASSSVPDESVSDELRAYPQDLLQSPLDVRQATARVTPGEVAGSPPRLSSGDELASPVRVSKSESGFAALIARENLSVGVILVSLFVATFWGAVHALSPGHGKAIVAAYLIGTRGTPRHALYLGLIVTVTHTIGVFALGLVTLALSEVIVPDQLYPWLNLVAALLVVAVGTGVLRLRLREWLGKRLGGENAHDHDQGHGHDHPNDDGHTHGHRHGSGHRNGHDHSHRDGHEHGHDHHHVPEPGMGWRGLLGAGISGGLLPCPSALVVLLAAISLHRIGYGLVLILAFSVGLAATISAMGLIAITAKSFFRRASFEGRLVRLLPAVSALVIVAFGIAMTVRAVPGVA